MWNETVILEPGLRLDSHFWLLISTCSCEASAQAQELVLCQVLLLKCHTARTGAHRKDATMDLPQMYGDKERQAVQGQIPPSEHGQPDACSNPPHLSCICPKRVSTELQVLYMQSLALSMADCCEG